MNRRNHVRFSPKATIEILEKGDPPAVLSDEEKQELVKKYLEVGSYTGSNILFNVVYTFDSISSSKNS